MRKRQHKKRNTSLRQSHLEQARGILRHGLREPTLKEPATPDIESLPQEPVLGLFGDLDPEQATDLGIALAQASHKQGKEGQ